MPYIKEDERNLVVTEGQLNFAISSLVDSYIALHGMKYATVNAAIGALECAKLELYRRIISPYEDQKILENGDIYTCNKKEQ